MTEQMSLYLDKILHAFTTDEELSRKYSKRSSNLSMRIRDKMVLVLSEEDYDCNNTKDYRIVQYNYASAGNSYEIYSRQNTYYFSSAGEGDFKIYDDSRNLISTITDESDFFAYMVINDSSLTYTDIIGIFKKMYNYPRCILHYTKDDEYGA